MYVPALGHIRPALALANELVKKGETIHFFTTSEFKSLIVGENIIYENYWFWEKRLALFSRNIDVDKPYLSYEDFEYLADVRIDVSNQIAKIFEKNIVKIKADYIIHDQTVLFGQKIAKSLHIPSYCHYVEMIYNIELLNIRPEFYLKYEYKFDPNEYPDHDLSVKHINKVADKCYMKYGKRMDDREYILNDFKIKGKYNYSFLLKELQIDSKSLNDAFTFCGVPQMPEFKTHKNSMKTLFITLGTHTRGEFDKIRNLKFFQTCIRAFAATDFDVIISTGDIDCNILNNESGNIKIYDKVDQIRVLDESTIMIGHGGLSGTLEALYYNTPIIVLPCKYDQFAVASMLTENRLGYLYDIDLITADQILSAVKQIIQDNICFKNVETISKRLRTQNGARIMANAIVALASDNKNN